MSTEFESLWRVATLEREQQLRRAERNAWVRRELSEPATLRPPRLHTVAIGPYRLVVVWGRAA